MKVTKYPQSCLILGKNGKRLAIDPGSLVSAKYRATELMPLDGILITHEHPDHADPALLKALATSTMPVIGNQSTASTLGEGIITQVVADAEHFSVAGFEVTARELPHCPMMDGSAGPQNTGYVIDGVFFHPGDGVAIEDLQVTQTAVPIAGPDISPRDVYGFITQVGAQTVVPIHYDVFPADPEFFADLLQRYDSGLKVIVLASGQSAEL